MEENSRGIAEQTDSVGLEGSGGMKVDVKHRGVN